MSLRTVNKLVKLSASMVLMFCTLTGYTVSAKNSCAISKVQTKDKVIALTFDDGPDSKKTEEILDILDLYNIKATFFVIGTNCKTNGELLKRELSAGHEIGNHTFTHPHLCKITPDKLKEEILKDEEIINSICEYKPRLFRPPEGVCSTGLAEIISALGYTSILWSVDTEDWRHTSADKIVKNVLENIKPGGIILCHDYICGESNTAEAIKIFIPELLKQGYTFVTVSELIDLREPCQCE